MPLHYSPCASAWRVASDAIAVMGSTPATSSAIGAEPSMPCKHARASTQTHPAVNQCVHHAGLPLCAFQLVPMVQQAPMMGRAAP